MTLALKLDAAPPIPADARVIAYVRVSTDDQAAADRGSLPEQERQCRAFAVARGLAVDHVWSDAGVSGRDESRLERLTHWCEAHPRPKAARGLVVALKRDRWARFVHDDNASAYFEYRLARAGWDVDFVLEPKTDNQTANAVMAVVHGRQAAEESEEKGRRAYNGMRDQAALARWLGRAPFGYVRVGVKRNDDKNRRPLKPFEHAADDEYVVLAEGKADDVRTVRLIFRRAAAGASCKAIADELNDARVPGPFDVYENRGRSKRWRGCTVRALLKNPTYGGAYVWNRRHNVGKANGRDVRETRPPAEWRRIENAVTRLVDAGTFAAVEAEFASRRTRRRVETTAYLLTGLATCGRCGNPLVGGGGHAPDRFYKCSGGDDDKTDRPACPAPRLTVNQPALESLVVARIAARVAALVASGRLAETLNRIIGARPDERRARAALDKERGALTAKRDRLEDRVLDGTIAKARGKVKLAEIEAALVRVDRDLNDLRLEPTRVDLTKERDRLLKLAADFPARLKAADPVAARHLLGLWLTRLVVHPSAAKGGDLRIDLALRAVPAGAGAFSEATPARPGNPGKMIVVERLTLHRPHWRRRAA